MSLTALDSAEAQWQAQLAAMKASLAELKLPNPTNPNTPPYGADLNLDDEDDYSSTVLSGSDVWDFIDSSSDDDYSSDQVEDDEGALSDYPNASLYGPQWLRSKCLLFATHRQGLSGEDLQEQILALLSSDSVDEELQSTLTDIIGFDDLDFVIELIAHREAITAPAPFEPAGRAEGTLGRLQSKRQREETLRQRDYEHKNATLGPSLDRDGPTYPHVYKAHSAGNTLDSRGKKYGLPVGSDKKEEEVCILLLSRFMPVNLRLG